MESLFISLSQDKCLSTEPAKQETTKSRGELSFDSRTLNAVYTYFEMLL